MDFSWLSALFGAFGLGLLKLIWDIVKYHLDKKREDKKQIKQLNDKKEKIRSLFTQLITITIQIQDLLNELVLSINAKRGLIIKLTNGGGIPNLGTDQKIYVLYEYINRPDLEPVKPHYQGYVVDDTYKKIISKMFESDYVLSKVADMENGFLKNIYLTNKVDTFILMELTTIPSLNDNINSGALIFLSLHFYDKKEKSPELSMKLNIFKSKIGKLFDEFYLTQKEIISL